MIPKISVLIPSRKRPAGLANTVRSLYNNAILPEQIEVLVRFDDDDESSLYAAQELAQDYPMTILTGPRGGGYGDLHLFYNELAAKSRGDFLFLFNDDAIMHTKAWDNIVASQPARICALWPQRANGRPWSINIFPIISRDIVEILGHMSLHPLNDLWIWVITKRLGLIKSIPVFIEHINPRYSKKNTNKSVLDETAQDIANISRDLYRDFTSYQNYLLMRKDANKLAKSIPFPHRIRYILNQPRIHLAMLRRRYREDYHWLQRFDKMLISLRKRLKWDPIP